MIQSTVADAISIALQNLMEYREEQPDIRFKIGLQIHDAILLEVPYAFTDVIIDTVLPECMSAGVPIYPTDLNGEGLTRDGSPAVDKPYNLAIDTAVMLRWGEKLTLQQAELHGIPVKYSSRR